MQKRTFLKTGLTAAAGLAMLPHLDLLAEPPKTPPATGFTLPPLPYAFAALEPHIDARTMELHHGKHHKAYVDKLNEALKGKPEAALSIEALQKKMDAQPEAVRNNGGGHYNHSLFWKMMAPQAAPGKPGPKLLEAINRDLGSYDEFVAAFEKEAKGVFGSGWAWLSKGADGKLFVSSTANQDNPLMPLKGIKNGLPILGLDVWEHAYYLKNLNKRPNYISTFWNVVNWAECEKRMALKA